jgi:hypothetical protein
MFSIRNVGDLDCEMSASNDLRAWAMHSLRNPDI